jgi:hypothetical protein
MYAQIDPRTLTPAQHAALFDAARRDAALLRRQAIDDAFGALGRALARLSAYGRSRWPAGPRHSGPRTAAPLSA